MSSLYFSFLYFQKLMSTWFFVLFKSTFVKFLLLYVASRLYCPINNDHSILLLEICKTPNTNSGRWTC